MTISTSDYFVAERGGASFKLTGGDILTFVRSQLGTTEYRVADIAARNALTDLTAGDVILVDDASADSTVVAGWAIYRHLSASTYQKIAEQESIDVNITAANLALTRVADTVTVTNTGGTDVTIPAATASEAGVMTAAQVSLLALLTATGAINLDTIASKSHDAATASGTATTNPVTVNTTTQVVGFSISQLADLP